MVLMSILWDGARDSWFSNCQIVIGHFRYLHTYHRKTSTLHCRGKNRRSKKIGQTNQKMIHFAPNMYVSGKISALRSRTQNVRNFGTLKKEENCLKQRDFRICGFLCVFFFSRGFAGLFLDRLRRCKHFFVFVSPSPKTCNQSHKTEDQSSI